MYKGRKRKSLYNKKLIAMQNKNAVDIINSGRGVSLKSKRLAMSLLGEMTGVRGCGFASDFGMPLVNRFGSCIDIVLSVYPEAVFSIKENYEHGFVVKGFDIDFGDPEFSFNTGRLFNVSSRMPFKEKAVIATNAFCDMCKMITPDRKKRFARSIAECGTNAVEAYDLI